jgi:hypothetical protein
MSSHLLNSSSPEVKVTTNFATLIKHFLKILIVRMVPVQLVCHLVALSMEIQSSKRNREMSIGKESNMSMLLRTPAKKLVREHIQCISEEATMADALSAFHGAGCSGAAGAPNGKDSSFVITCSGMPAGDFQQKQHEIDASLKAKGMRLVSVSYHEDPVTGQTTHTCVVKAAVTI